MPNHTAQVFIGLILGACVGSCTILQNVSPLLEEYFRAECRLYTESDCISAANEDCDGFGAMASVDECVWLLLGITKRCPGFQDEMHRARADVEQCIEALDTLDCAADRPLCSDMDRTVLDLPACAFVSDIYHASCE